MLQTTHMSNLIGAVICALLQSLFKKQALSFRTQVSEVRNLVFPCYAKYKMPRSSA